MYNEAIKIDPRCIQAYNSKGSKNFINRKFASGFIKILISCGDV